MKGIVKKFHKNYVFHKVINGLHFAESIGESF